METWQISPVGGQERILRDAHRDHNTSKAWGNFDWPWRRLWRKWKKGFSYL